MEQILLAQIQVSQSSPDICLVNSPDRDQNL